MINAVRRETFNVRCKSDRRQFSVRYGTVTNNYVCPRNARTEMYAGRVAYCPLVSHVAYAPDALLTLVKNGTDRQTDGRTDARSLHYA